MTEYPTTGGELADYLDAAADVLERDGWIQNENGSRHRGWCALGALGASSFSLTIARSQVRHAVSVNELARTALSDYLRAEGYECPYPVVEPVGVIANWNDRPGRTAEDVVAALRKTALSVREQA